MQAVAKIARMVGMVSLAVLTAVSASAESAALSDGRPCGKRSAYSRPGAAAPLCYERDVTQAMVDAYRARTTKH